MEINQEYQKLYSIEDFHASSYNVIQEYICPLCKGVVTDAIVDKCGHIFCNKCMTKYLSVSSICPVTKELYQCTKLFPIILVSNILNKQILFCKNRYKNCLWEGTLATLEEHLQNECSKVEIKCANENCDVVVQKDQMNLHEEICEFRLVECPDCKQVLIWKNFTVSHREDCPMIKLECPNQCGSMIPRKEMELHKTKLCIYSLHDCPYASYGCTHKYMKSKLNSHLLEFSHNHNLFVMEFMRIFKNEFLEKTENLTNLFNSYEKRLSVLNSNNKNSCSNVEHPFHNPEKMLMKKKNRENTNPIIPLESTLDLKNHSKGVEIKQNRATVIDNSNDHKFVFAAHIINTEKIEWSITIKSINEWMAFGVGIRELIIKNKYQFVGYTPKLPHGCFVISSNGYLWNCNEVKENYSPILDFPELKEGDVINFKFLPKQKQLCYRIKQNCGKITNVQTHGLSLVPCVIMMNKNDEIVFNYI